MTSQIFNFLWLNLDMPPLPDPEDGSVREPLPLKYIENVRKTGEMNPDTDVVLWVDSKRLTERQLRFLQNSIEADMPNVHLKDLRAIPAYDQEQLYNEPETNPRWRNSGQTSMIWRQVDAAKVLISLQGNADQAFFADLDHAHLAINSSQVQGMLDKHGLMIGSSGATSLSIENQLWGLTRNRRPFFESYYITALKSAYAGRNAWDDLVSKVSKELERREGIGLSEICLPIGDDGTSAQQTGHEWRDGYNKSSKPALVDKGELTRVFNTRSTRPQRATPDLDVVWAPTEKVYPPKSLVTQLYNRLKMAMDITANAI